MADSEDQYSPKREISFYIDLNISPKRPTDERETSSGPSVNADVLTRKKFLIDLNISPDERSEDEATSLCLSRRADIASSSNCKEKEKETSSKSDDTGATNNDVAEARQKEGDSVLKGERKSRNARKRADFGKNEKQICNANDDDDDIQILCEVNYSHRRKYVKIGENTETEYTLKNNVDVLKFINEKHKDGVSNDRSVSDYVAESELEDTEEYSCNSPDSGFLIARGEDHSDDLVSNAETNDL